MKILSTKSAHGYASAKTGESCFEPGTYIPDGDFVFVRHPSPAELAKSHQMLVAEIGADVAPLATVATVFARNPLSWWLIFRSADESRKSAEAVGLCAYLPLNARGFEALKAGALNARDPDLELLARRGEDPVALYLWAIVAHGLSDIAGKLVGHAIGLDLYESLPMFGTIGTEAGLAALRRSSKSATEAAALKIGSPFEIRLPPKHIEHQRALTIFEGERAHRGERPRLETLGARTSSSASSFALRATEDRSGDLSAEALANAETASMAVEPEPHTGGKGKDSHAEARRRGEEEGFHRRAGEPVRNVSARASRAPEIDANPGQMPGALHTAADSHCLIASAVNSSSGAAAKMPGDGPDPLRVSAPPREKDGSATTTGVSGYPGPRNRPTLDARVAATADDIARIFALRAAVFMAEQDCPYEEEFDGNDYSGTHILGLVDDAPAATLRIRYFADFVKIERLAVLPRYRRTLIARKVIEHGIALVRRKGYTRMYGQSQLRLVDFWRKFGFEPMRKNTPLVFSDHEYVEIAGALKPDDERLTMESDPYMLIRPEGRWDEAGVLDRSASREATNPW